MKTLRNKGQQEGRKDRGDDCCHRSRDSIGHVGHNIIPNKRIDALSWRTKVFQNLSPKTRRRRVDCETHSELRSFTTTRVLILVLYHVEEAIVIGRNIEIALP